MGHVRLSLSGECTEGSYRSDFMVVFLGIGVCLPSSNGGFV